MKSMKEQRDELRSANALLERNTAELAQEKGRLQERVKALEEWAERNAKPYKDEVSVHAFQDLIRRQAALEQRLANAGAVECDKSARGWGDDMEASDFAAPQATRFTEPAPRGGSVSRIVEGPGDLRPFVPKETIDALVGARCFQTPPMPEAVDTARAALWNKAVAGELWPHDKDSFGDPWLCAVSQLIRLERRVSAIAEAVSRLVRPV